MISNLIRNKGASSWLKVDLNICRKNLLALDRENCVIDLTPPFINKSWQYLEEDVIRSGINIIASRNPQDLLPANNHFCKILLPGFSRAELGYAAKNIIPVVSGFEEILALSNLAQENDTRISFMIHIRTLNEEFSFGDYGYYDLIGKVRMLPMVDFAGVFFDTYNSINFNEKNFIRNLYKVSDTNNLLLLCCETDTNFKAAKKLTSWPLAGICKEILPLAISAGFIAHPINKTDNETIFRLEIGLSHGLPESFPSMIEGFNARVKEINLYTTILGVKNFASDRPYPYRGILIGRQSGENVSQHQWNHTYLKNYLLHFNKELLLLDQ
ncbi:MAG: hypothetical protein ACQETH_04045 [Candidatus Rifleibacteriota bacterium]